MTDEYYPEMAAGGDEEAAPEPVEQEGAEPKTALLPKSLFGADLKPGDTVTVKISHVYEDEVEVEPQGAPDTEAPVEPEASPTADEEIDMMAGMKGR